MRPYFSEALNASFGGNSDSRILTSGSISLLAAGQMDNTSMVVELDTSAAGSVNGTVTVNLASDGTGTSGLGITALPSQDVGVTGNIEMMGSVFRLANPVINDLQPINLGNHRVGDAVVPVALSITNDVPDDGFSESLNAAANGTTGGVIVAGSFNLLGAGQTNNADIAVSIDTTSAGSKNGTATIDFVSDGFGTSDLGQTPLASQNVAVTGAVFNPAEAGALPPSIALAARRVGEAAATGSFAIQNVAPAGPFTEGLNATVGTAPAGFTLTGATVVDNLAPEAGPQVVDVILSTATAGSFGGFIAVDFASSGANSLLADLALPSQNVALSGNVYAPAVADADTTLVDFGTVRVGDVVAEIGRMVANTASGALTDVLVGGFSSVGVPFTADAGSDLTGAGVAGGNATTVLFGLNTGTAGIYSGQASLDLASHNPEMTDLDLGSVVFNLAGTVNALADPTFVKVGGDGAFSDGGDSFLVDFGTVVVGTLGTMTIHLGLLNDVSGPADLLSGAFDLTGLGDFAALGFDAFASLAPGDVLGGLSVIWDASGLGTGLYSGSIVLNGLSVFAGLDDVMLDPVTLQLRGRVVAASTAVPEPPAILLLLFGGATLFWARRRAAARSA